MVTSTTSKTYHMDFSWNGIWGWGDIPYLRYVYNFGSVGVLSIEVESLHQLPRNTISSITELSEGTIF